MTLRLTQDASRPTPLRRHPRQAAFIAGLCASIAIAGADAQELRGPVRTLDGRMLSAAQIERTVRALMDSADVAGLALALLNDGRVVYRRAFGYANLEARRPLTDTTVMYGASFTKGAFAFMVLTLADEGVIDLDHPIARILAKPFAAYPDWAELANDPRAQRITPRMLLSHTSGFANFRFLNPGEKLLIHFDPGTRYAYSGEGLNLLGFVLEELTGKSVTTFMRERVFDRFGMRRTGMVWDSTWAGDLAMGHDESGKVLGHNRRSRPRPAGSMDTNIQAFGEFVAGVARGDGLSPWARESLFAPQIRIRSGGQFPSLRDDITNAWDGIKLSYGLGWGLFWSPRGKAWFKEGHDDGWENYTIYFQDAGVGLVVMTNSSNGESIYVPLLARLIGDTYTPAEWNGYTPFKRGAEGGR